MVMGKVTGSVWATKKDEHLTGQKLLVINLIKNGKTTKDEIVATDMDGAGQGDVVLVALSASAPIYTAISRCACGCCGCCDYRPY